MLVNHLHEIRMHGVDCFVSAETSRQLSFAYIRIADKKKPFVSEYVAQVLRKQQTRDRRRILTRCERVASPLSPLTA